MMNLREIDRLVGKEFFGVQELTVEEAVEKFKEKCYRTFTVDGCIVDGYTKLKFDRQEYDRLFSGGYYIPNWVKWLKENSVVVTEYPRYSSDIRYAWQLVDKLKIAVIPQSEGAPIDMKYLAEIDERPFGNHYEAFAETAPLAICLVALKSVGVEVGVNEE
jgi:hypothetical protein